MASYEGFAFICTLNITTSKIRFAMQLMVCTFFRDTSVKILLIIFCKSDLQFKIK